jgi:hypothetical protein
MNGAKALVGVSGALNIAGPGAPVTDSVVLARLDIERLSSDGSVSTETITHDYRYTPSQTGETVRVDFNLFTNAEQSGFYRFTLKFQIDVTTDFTTPILVELFGAVLNTAEYTTVGSAWYENTQYTGTVDRLSSKMWPMGVSSLFSFRGNVLQNAGSISALNVSDTDRPMFYQATSTTQAALSQVVPACRQYNDGAGGSILKGLWSYASPSSWFATMIPTTDSRLVAAATAPCLSYWPATNQSPGALNVLYFSPQGQGENPTMMLRVTTTVTALMALKTQVLTPCDLRPFIS